MKKSVIIPPCSKTVSGKHSFKYEMTYQPGKDLDDAGKWKEVGYPICEHCGLVNDMEVKK
jgi:hypothetical protein